MALTRRIVIEIDPADSRELTAQGIRLVLAQPAGNAPPNLVWLALPPATLTTVDWTERCGLYAGDAPTHGGAAIGVRSVVYPACDGSAYAFSGTAFALLPGAQRIPHGHYDVINESPYPTTFGLLGEVAINGETVRAPVNAIMLPAGFRAGFAAAARVYVWLQGDLAGGHPVSMLRAGAALISFERYRTSQRCRYDRRSQKLTSS
jgi:hypothetical protein